MEVRLEIPFEIFNDIVKFTKHYIAKDGGPREILTQISIKVENDKLEAVALDGVKLGKMTFDFNGHETVEMVIPLVKPYPKNYEKGGTRLTIIDNGEDITFETAVGSQSYKKIKGKFFSYEEVLKQKEKPKETFCMDPKLLATALKGFSKDSWVKFEYYGDGNGIMLRNHDSEKIAFVLPKIVQEN